MARPGTLRAEMWKLAQLGGPLALIQLGQGLTGVVDVAVLGRAGPTLLGGVGLGNAYFFGIGILGMGVMHGLDPLIAQALGAGERGRARRLVWQGLWLALALSAVLALPIVLSPRVMIPLGIDPAAVEQAAEFLSWRVWGLPFFLVYFAPRALLQAQHRTRPMLLAVALANVVNLVLVVLLVFGGAGLPAWAGPLRAVPAYGVAGSAWASNIASVLQMVVLAFAVRSELRGAPRNDAGRRAALPDRRELALAFRVGLPAGLHMCAEANFFAVLASTIAGRLGTIPLAAHQLALQLPSLTFLGVIGLGNAGSVRVGQAVGAGDREGARRAGLAALLGASGFMTCTAVAFVSLADPIARLMTTDPQVYAVAVPLLRLAGAFQLFDGLQGVAAGVLRGAGDIKYTFAANMLAFWALGLPVLLLLTFWLRWGVVGLWVGFVFSLAILAAILVRRFLRISSREIVPLAEREA